MYYQNKVQKNVNAEYMISFFFTKIAERGFVYAILWVRYVEKSEREG